MTSVPIASDTAQLMVRTRQIPTDRTWCACSRWMRCAAAEPRGVALDVVGHDVGTEIAAKIEEVVLLVANDVPVGSDNLSQL